MKKRMLTIFFILLVFHIGLIIPKTKFECACHVFPESLSSCCNCPLCVSQRGGFISACGCHEKTEESSGNLPMIKRAICFCGSSGADFDLPAMKYPALAAENLFSLPILEIYHFFSLHSTLSSQVYLTPPGHPS